ncbi:glycosyltransferase family 4 protein [candidate division KSB1 bacterium]|nr:glycosyltransferase family 4 protein [candidate division KSB1 bacterium]
MNIGIIIGRFGDIDGVSLETSKWIDVLHDFGHKIFVLSGNFSKYLKNTINPTLYPPLAFFSPECEWEQKRAFFYPDDDPDELLEHLERTSEAVAIQIFKWIMANKIDVILPQNALALPCHLSMGMGIKKVVEHTGIKTICHDHDFYWERGDRYKTPHKEIEEIVKTTFPLQQAHVRHAVINSEAKKYLSQNFRMNSIVVPNVMDFNKPYGKIDDYNKDLPDAIDLNKNDIAMLQVTRIVSRKGIEVALDLTDRLADDNVKLVITGSYADDERIGYYKKLINIINKRKLNNRVIFGRKKIQTYRGKTKTGEKIYSISDSYAHAAACTYFSTYEGFGNAFVECVLAKKPIFVNNYKPVYWPEIGSKGFKTVMLEDNKLTDQAVKEIDEIIHNPKLAKEIADYNFDLGKKYFSYKVLEQKLFYLFHHL